MKGKHEDRIEADYVIVGAGSAGCVLAHRLSEDPAIRVVLIEAGGDDRPLHDLRNFATKLLIHIPAGFTSVMNAPNVNWGYVSEPDPSVGGRTFRLSRGRVLGGSSSINGMIYIRGLAQDFDAWRQLGCVGWGAEDVLPYFKMSERQERGADDWHGGEGPLSVSDGGSPHPMSAVVRQAFVEAGVPAKDDLNGAAREGVTFTQSTIDRGCRHSAAVAYLHPVLSRPNLVVIKNALATGISIERGSARGVHFARGGTSGFAAARQEVILAGGAINSPQLLQLSGIGDPATLKTHGIEPQVDSPNVGRNLQDHYSSMLQARLRKGTASLNATSRGARLAIQVARYAMSRQGLLADGAAQLTALARSHPALNLPDMQYFSSPATVDFARTAALGRMVMHNFPGLTIGGYQLRPLSRGSISIANARPATPPRIQMNFLSDPADQQTTVAGLRLGRAIMGQPALAPFLDGMVSPDPLHMSDDELLDFARATGSTAYHYSGTCAMGDSGSVLTPRLKVRGIDGLRVVDASVMPRLVSGNTNAAVTMIAEKAAAMLREDRLVSART